MKRIIFIAIIFIFSLTTSANAQKLLPKQISALINAYRFYKDIPNVTVKVPTVAEMSFNNDLIERFDFALLDKTTNSFEPYYFKQKIITNRVPILITTNPKTNNEHSMIDKNTQTYTNFLLPENAQGKVKIILSSLQPISSSALTVLLDNNVALPTSVEIRAFVNNKNQIVVANRKMNQHTINFPLTTSDKWEITFTYSQPLRISELRLNQDNVDKSNYRAVRFLYQPGHSYRIYFDPDRLVNLPVGERGNLSRIEDVLTVPFAITQKNPTYTMADTDKDGIPDIQDNCVSINNPNQKDINNNGRGDACDDFDQDGIINSKDNCPNNPNRNQKDTDNDGIGDVCDAEESRVTEKYPWIPWIGIGSAAFIFIILIILMARTKPTNDQDQKDE